MNRKIKNNSRILEAVHEGVSDLHRLGLIDKRKMRKYDALCLEPVKDDPPQITGTWIVEADLLRGDEVVRRGQPKRSKKARPHLIGKPAK